MNAVRWTHCSNVSWTLISIVTLLLSGCASTRGEAFAHATGGIPPLSIPFGLPLRHTGQEVYREAFVAVDVLSCTVDGAPIIGQRVEMAVDPAFDRARVRASYYVYMYPLTASTDGTAGRDLTTTAPGSEVQRFRIPKYFNELKIVYRIRLPNGRTTASNTVIVIGRAR